jgi:hypothetical protein
MTQTVQSCSFANLSETENDLTISERKAEDNMSLLLSINDDLNTLCKKLSRLDYVIQSINIEKIINRKGGEE